MEVKKVSKEIVSDVLKRVQSLSSEGSLLLPKDYSPENALKHAELNLLEVKDKNGKSALDVCTPTSIARSLFKMTSYGLTVLKKQGYFIVRGTELCFDVSYMGNLALAKRFGNVKDVKPFILYKGDEFKFSVNMETASYEITKHDPKIENQKNENITGGYAIVLFNDGSRDIVIMTIDEIRQSWKQGQMKGEGSTHKNFTQEMAKRTLINNACKRPINSSSDAVLIDESHESIHQNSTEDMDFEEINAAELLEEQIPIPDISADELDLDLEE